MDPQYVQHLRYKLQKRVARLNSVSGTLFSTTLRQFWVFFEQEPVFFGILEDLLAQFLQIDETMEQVLSREGVVGDTEEEAAAIGYKILKHISAGEGDPRSKIYSLAQKYGRGGTLDEAVDTVRMVFLEPFYEYVDEQMDDQRAILALLLRYKHRSEWFHRDHLWGLSRLKRVAEMKLALDLYAYLYDQGIDFHIEPSSIRGELDLIAAQNTPDPLLLDAKIFDGASRGTSYLRKAFNQIYTYTQQYNEPFGYLMIYNTTDRDLHFALPSLQYSNIPVFTYNHKTIFFITVDIYPHEKPVSQRPPLETIEITAQDLVAEISDIDGAGQ